MKPRRIAAALAATTIALTGLFALGAGPASADPLPSGPTVTVTGDPVYPGSPVTVIGTGFGPSGGVFVLVDGWYDDNWNTDGHGAVTGVIAAPSVPGVHTIDIQDPLGGGAASTTFTVLDLVTSASGPTDPVNLGDSITITGTGFAADELVTATVEGAPVGAGSVGADGTVQVAVIVPLAWGSGDIVVTLSGGASGASAAVTITVGAAADPGPTVMPTEPVIWVLAAPWALIGDLVTIFGSGFTAYETVTITVETNLGVETITAQVADDGTIAATWTVPPGVADGTEAAITAIESASASALSAGTSLLILVPPLLPSWTDCDAAVESESDPAAWAECNPPDVDVVVDEIPVVVVDEIPAPPPVVVVDPAPKVTPAPAPAPKVTPAPKTEPTPVPVPRIEAGLGATAGVDRAAGGLVLLVAGLVVAAAGGVAARRATR